MSRSLVLQPVQHLVHGLSIEIQGTDTEVLAKELGGLRCKRISSSESEELKSHTLAETMFSEENMKKDDFIHISL